MNTIETERLILRSYRSEDATDLPALIGNWNVAKMLARVPYPYTDDDAADFVSRVTTEKENPDDIAFVIESRDTGHQIGGNGIYHRPIGGAEIGYWLAEPYWGRGFMTEAARALVAHFFAISGDDTLYSGYFADNPASGKILTEKLGFTQTGTSQIHSLARKQNVEHMDVELTRANWQNHG